MAGPSTSTTCAWITFGLGLLGPLMYTWQDPRFGISVPPYAVNFTVGCCRSSVPGLNCWYRDLGIIFVSAPESILHRAGICFPCGLSDRQTSRRASSLHTIELTFMVRGVAVIGPRNKWSLNSWVGSDPDSFTTPLVASISCTFFFFNFDRHTLARCPTFWQ